MHLLALVYSSELCYWLSIGASSNSQSSSQSEAAAASKTGGNRWRDKAQSGFSLYIRLVSSVAGLRGWTTERPRELLAALARDP
jgi:hypothetical protein